MRHSAGHVSTTAALNAISKDLVLKISLGTIPPDMHTSSCIHVFMQVSPYVCHTDIFGEVDVAADSGSS